MTAFLTVPKHGWLVVLAGLAVLGLAALVFTPHRHRCCGQTFTTPEFDAHLKRAHNQ